MADLMPTPLPDNIAARLDGLKPSGDGWIARCVTHEDRNPSLSLKVTDDGKVLAKCHAGCDQDGLAEALGLHAPVSSAEWTPHGDATAVYDYRDENGRTLFQVLRTADKQFPQRRPDSTAKSGWRWSLGDTRRVLYRLPELVQAVSEGKSVNICEGEKDALALVDAGRVATCNPGGAGKWRPEYNAYFIDADVTIFADKDKPGQQHARTVASSLEGVARRVWIVEAADPHKDIAAHLAAGLGLSDVVVTRKPEEDVAPDLAPDIHEILNSTDPVNDWLVIGLLERGDRLMLTGIEGLGKSMWLRMMAACLAYGINPVTFENIEPLRVLMLDCENSMRLSRRKFRPIIDHLDKVRGDYEHGRLRVSFNPNGINLAGGDDAAWLLERVTAHRPDVIILGPLYRLHRDSPNDEVIAHRVTDALDAARNAAGAAMILEAHAGHAKDGNAKRALRPAGSSFFLRWPEFGLGLRPAEGIGEGEFVSMVDVVPWRGLRDERDWPTQLRRGGDHELPWVPSSFRGLMSA